jgi:spermidine synthase
VIVLALLFILSGAAGLIYESVWARYLSLLVGHSAYAQVIVLVIFLGGMALGSLAVGRRSERIRSPLLWYAVVEAIVAVIAIVFHDVFVGVTTLAYDHWLPRLSVGPAVTAATWTLAAILILPQSILLGATFPLMTAGALRRRPESSGAAIGLLYFANSLGAAIGALAGGFTLVARYGLPGTLRAAAILNFIVALGVLAGFVRPSRVGPRPRDTAPEASPGRQGVSPLERVLLGVSFMTAFSSFLYEIAWTRMLSMVNGSATHSFELMLSAFILGLAIGSLWISRRADASADRLKLLARLQWAMGLAAIATLPLYLWSFDLTASLLGAIRETESGYRLYSVARYGIGLAIMLPATFFAGTTLPLITKILLASGSGERVIGGVYGVNTIGSIVGAAAASLLLVPLIGLKWVLVGGGLMDIGVGIALLLWRGRPTGDTSLRAAAFADRGWTLAIGATLGAIIGIAIVTPFAPARLASGVYRYKVVPTNDVFRYLYYKDGRTATVSVRQLSRDSLSLITIATNGKPDASMAPQWARPYVEGMPRLVLDQDMSTQVMLPLLVLAHAPRAKVGAVVGQGSGITSHILLASPTLERLHTIEIEPEMIRGSRFFYPGNRRVFDDPRSSFAIDDARAFLSASGPPFDFVVSEPSNPWVSGVSGLFTVEFYRRVKARLAPGGVFTQWFHMYEIDDASVASVIAGIDRVFGDYRVYSSSDSDLIIVATTADSLPGADWSVTSYPELRRDLAHFPPLTPAILDATVVGGRRTLHPWLSTRVVNSDFAPILDLNGERLRFRNLFADGFRELTEMRFDFAAAIEGRRRPLGRELDNPAPEITRPSTLTRGARLRFARSMNAREIGDTLTEQAAARLAAFDLTLSSGVPPLSWSDWLSQFSRVESDLHGAAAGEADEQFYSAVRSYLGRVNPPSGVTAAVDLHHGLAAWDFAEAARAGDTLIAELRAGHVWIPVELIRRGTAVARVMTGDWNGAGRVYTSLSTLGGTWSMADGILEEFVLRNLPGSPATGGESAAPAPPRH